MELYRTREPFKAALGPIFLFTAGRKESLRERGAARLAGGMR